MRMIKFRGLKIDTGEWVFGNLVNVRDGNTSRYYPCIVISYNHDSFDWIEVKPETVGQFTGLLDKNGIEIYEGDIVSVDDFSSVYSFPYTGKVIMRGGQWYVEYYREYRCCPPLFFDDFADRKTEVVGNIYDNPELQKGGDNDHT